MARRGKTPSDTESGALTVLVTREDGAWVAELGHPLRDDGMRHFAMSIDEAGLVPLIDGVAARLGLVERHGEMSWVGKDDDSRRLVRRLEKKFNAENQTPAESEEQRDVVNQ